MKAGSSEQVCMLKEALGLRDAEISHGQVLPHCADVNTAPSQSSEAIWPATAHRLGS